MSTETKETKTESKKRKEPSSDQEFQENHKKARVNLAEDVCKTCHRFIPEGHAKYHSKTDLKKEPDLSDFDEDPIGVQGEATNEDKCPHCHADVTKCPFAYCAGKPWCRNGPIRACVMACHSGFCANCAASLYCLWNVCSECSQKLNADGDCVNKRCDHST